MSWPLWRLRAFAAITITSAAIISFQSVRHLAEMAGFGWLAWLFPLTLDAVAAFGMDVWIRRSRAWREAAALAMVAISGSLVANVVDHWLTQQSVLAAVLGAVPPAMLAALLFVLHRHGRPEAQARAVYLDYPAPIGPVPERVTPAPSLVLTDPKPAPVRDRVTIPLARSNGTRKPAKTGTKPVPKSVETLAQEVRDRIAGGDEMTKRRVAAEYQIGSDKAGRVLRLAKGEG